MSDFVKNICVSSLCILSVSCVESSRREQTTANHCWMVYHYADGSGELVPRGDKPIGNGDVVAVSDVFVSGLSSPLEINPRSLGYRAKNGRMLEGRIY
jgi:hypothetical protein